MDIYLLDVEEWMQDCTEAERDPILGKLDEGRRRKVLAAKTPSVRAAQIGAGLLLQKIAQREIVRRDLQELRGKAQETQGLWGKARDLAWHDSVSTQALKFRACTASELLAELGEPVSTVYRYGENGKPYFENLPLFFNLSHSGSYVLCAVSGREVGADIQKYSAVDMYRIAERFFAERECQALEQCVSSGERQRLFFALWSRKEAYGKLTGKGAAAALGQDMEDVDAEWIQVQVPEGYAAAVCRFREETSDRSVKSALAGR